jgi:hypothetical protein
MPASGLKQPLRNESWKLTGLIATPDLVRHSDWAAILPPVAVIDEARGRPAAAPICDPDFASVSCSFTQAPITLDRGTGILGAAQSGP